MAKTVKIVLDEVEYEVPRLNVGQIEDLMETATGGKMRAFDALRIAMRRATPACENLNTVEATPEELAEAVRSICAISGVTLGQSGKMKAP